MTCRHCGSSARLPFVDLGSAPFSNSYLDEQDLRASEKWFPLQVVVCTECWLAQTEQLCDREELFPPDYAYFSSFSSTWVRHAEQCVSALVERFRLGASSRVIEIAANDGYLLQHVQKRGIPCLGVEPTASTAAAARDKGIEIVQEFFGTALAEKLATAGGCADVIIANNVLAHVPDINDFVAGVRRLLKEGGVAVFEFPHLMKMVAGVQFDTIYHEHYSYLSLVTVNRIFESQGLAIFDVQELATHGGSLRVYAQDVALGRHSQAARLAELVAREGEMGLDTAGYYEKFQVRVDALKNSFLEFLLGARREGRVVAGYGAAAKGNTLLNYAGVKADLIRFVVDRNPAKQGKFLPGSRIPIVGEARLQDEKPDYVVIFPWNLRQEVTAQLAYIRDWGGRLVTTVPSLAIDAG